ncbi:glycosyltransferase family 87 protein [Modestobacter excelsi]|uniref:glycosyltransferase family 87 protein n=1 Tax=Modestobacter excelsi TaxID=2213161 RepID=UPI00110D187F|nr:glycosyltransferase family 87 protein [Modestobacter excelsi]
MRRWLWPALAAAAFVLYNVQHWWDAPGDDWSSIWVGAAMVAGGRADLLYTIDPDRFTDVGDPAAWSAFAEVVGRQTLGHPYVHEPGFAYALSVLAGPGSWSTSLHVLLVLDVLALVGITWIVGRTWAPVLLQPVPFAVTLLVLSLSEPVRYGLWLGQTTPLILLLTIGAVALARRHPVLAGLLLAIPVSIKITPVLIAGWWLLDRRRRTALLGLLGGLAGLALVQLVLVDRSVVTAFVTALRHVQRTTTTGFSNQSLIAWLEDLHVTDPQGSYPTLEVTGWVSALSTGLLVVVVVAVLSRAVRMQRAGIDAERFAAAGLLTASLPFTSLSWTHYCVLLLVPAAVLVSAARSGAGRWPYLAVAVLVALNMQPLAVDGPSNLATPDVLIRSHLLAALVALVAVLALPARVWGQAAARPDAEDGAGTSPVTEPLTPIATTRDDGAPGAPDPVVPSPPAPLVTQGRSLG